MGLITFVFGAVILVFFPSQPDKLFILTEREKLIAIERVRRNQTGMVNHTFQPYQVLEALIDPRTWILFLCQASMMVANGALTNFASVIVQSLGYDVKTTCLLGLAGGGSEVLACLLIVWGLISSSLA